MYEFNRKVSYTLLVMIRKCFSLLRAIVGDVAFDLVGAPCLLSWEIFILGLALSCADKLLVFQWVRVVLLLWLVCFCSAVRGIS